MTFGNEAFENAHECHNKIEELLRADSWGSNDISDFVSRWSGRLWLTINQKMNDRIESVYSEILNANDPQISEIKVSLKNKTSRWKNSQIDRISPIIKKFLVRNQLPEAVDMDLHNRMQMELLDIGPVHTVWCHYIVDPRQFPPIDRFNYTAWRFIKEKPIVIPRYVPNNFHYLPIDSKTTDYGHFRDWFLDELRRWKGDAYSVYDVVLLDKSLMSLGAFIRNNADSGQLRSQYH